MLTCSTHLFDKLNPDCFGGSLSRVSWRGLPLKCGLRLGACLFRHSGFDSPSPFPALPVGWQATRVWFRGHPVKTSLQSAYSERQCGLLGPMTVWLCVFRVSESIPFARVTTLCVAKHGGRADRSTASASAPRGYFEIRRKRGESDRSSPRRTLPGLWFYVGQVPAKSYEGVSYPAYTSE